MLRAEELMVGDYLTFRDALKDNNLITVKVVAVDGATNELLASICGDPAMDIIDIDDELCGIPLTPEILEKNGFDINGIPEDMVPVEERDWSDDTYVWSRQETPDEVMEVCVYMDDLYNFFVEIICQYCHVDGVHIKYVHELQHALRLCGIDKTIEL